jgi:hypothetical protein
LKTLISKNKILTAKSRRTKRAVDGGDSAAFSGFIYTRTESWSWSFICARPTATNANRWLAKVKIWATQKRKIKGNESP